MTGPFPDPVDELVAVRNLLDRLARDRMVGRWSDQNERKYDQLCDRERSLLVSVAG